MTAHIATLMICTLIYSFIGWIYETVMFTVYFKKFINRGFLHGPLCPIYGIGAMLIILCIYGRTDSVPAIFFGCMFLSISLELATGLILEKVFDKRWWDYTAFPLNYRGLICVPGALAFAIMGVLLVKYIHPFVYGIISSIPPQTEQIIILASLLSFSVDLVSTLKNECGDEGLLSRLRLR